MKADPCSKQYSNASELWSVMGPPIGGGAIFRNLQDRVFAKYGAYIKMQKVAEQRAIEDHEFSCMSAQQVLQATLHSCMKRNQAYRLRGPPDTCDGDTSDECMIMLGDVTSENTLINSMSCSGLLIRLLKNVFVRGEDIALLFARNDKERCFIRQSQKEVYQDMITRRTNTVLRKKKKLSKSLDCDVANKRRTSPGLVSMPGGPEAEQPRCRDLGLQEAAPSRCRDLGLQDAPPSRCQAGLMPGGPDAGIAGLQDAPPSRCRTGPMPGRPDAGIAGLQDAPPIPLPDRSDAGQAR